MQKEFVKLEEDMFRAYFIILIFHLGFIFQGCAALECLDGSQKEEVEALKMSKEQISNEAERLKGENANLQRQIDALQEENQRIRNGHGNKIAKLRDEGLNTFTCSLKYKWKMFFVMLIISQRSLQSDSPGSKQIKLNRF